MNDIHTIYKKANLLMTNALEKYRKGDMEGGEKDRQLANELFDQAEMIVNGEAYKRTMMYGESRNFGIIYSTFEHNTKSLFESKEKRNCIGKFIKLIKENKLLKKQFEIYNCFRNAEGVVDARDFTNEAISLIPTFSVKEITEANEKLVDFIRENSLDEAFEINDELMSLYESVEYVLLNKKTYNNLNEYIEHEKAIVEYVSKNGSAKSNEKADIDKLFNEHIEKYNSLNDDEVEYMDKLMNDKGEQEKMFNEQKEELLNTIKETFSNVTDENTLRWQNVYENIEERTFNEETCMEDISRFIEIRNEIKSN